MLPLEALLNRIAPPCETARAAAHARWASRAKPLGGLGLLERQIEDIAALTGSADVRLTPRAVLVLCADNGVVAQGVSQSGSEVTAIVAKALGAGQSTVCRMAAAAQCAVVPVDVGIRDFPGAPGVLNRRVANGTADITLAPAMTRAQAECALRTGMELVRGQQEAGVRLLAAGEMGIGNTTTAAAVACALLGQPAQVLTGRGAGLSDAGLRRKTAAVETALAHRHPDPADPLEVLARVGGLDIAAMCGVFLGGALYRVPVLIDGVISAAAALCAARLCPASTAAMLASHTSAEPAAALLLKALGKDAPIAAGLHLGEGTGAVAAMPLLDLALTVYRDGSSFDAYGMDAYTPQGGAPC